MRVAKSRKMERLAVAPQDNRRTLLFDNPTDSGNRDTNTRRFFREIDRLVVMDRCQDFVVVAPGQYGLQGTVVFREDGPRIAGQGDTACVYHCTHSGGFTDMRKIANQTIRDIHNTGASAKRGCGCR
jgi:hypothetical protein